MVATALHRSSYPASNFKANRLSRSKNFHLSLLVAFGVFWFTTVGGIIFSEAFAITTSKVQIPSSLSSSLITQYCGRSSGSNIMAFRSSMSIRKRLRNLDVLHRCHHHHHHHHHLPAHWSKYDHASPRSMTRRWNSIGFVSAIGKNSVSSSLLLASPKNTNESIVKARLEVSSAKRRTRQAYLEQDRQRNLRIKQILHKGGGAKKFSTNGTAYEVPPMHAVRVSVDKTLRKELRMNGREKRGRVFIEMNSEGCQTFRGLKMAVHGFFRCLRKSTYTLSASLPIVLDDGSIFSPLASSDKDDHSGDSSDGNGKDDIAINFWPIETDEDVIYTFQKAIDFFNAHNANVTASNPHAVNCLARPSILLHVQKDPNAPPPDPIPSYLVGMPDLKETESMTMLSFYAFPPPPPSKAGDDMEAREEGGIKHPEEFGALLRKVWKPFGALGRIYVASEGVNAQMAVPTNILENFMECCMQIPELGIHMENGINIDPKPLSMEDFKVAGDMNGKPEPPFKSLNIRVRGQIVADGLDKVLDWQKAGYDMPPLEWHEKLKEVKNQSQQNNEEGEGRKKKKSSPLIFDCRNDYETAVGQFEGAQPLNTTSFRETWDVLKDQLKDTPNDTPIMTYCTGGIRCVKVGAYLTQELGFTNVSRLAGGIIAYDRAINEDASTSASTNEKPLFKGTNYVFDGRVGRQITDDALAKCITCGEKTNLVSNCKNNGCHKRMVQCKACRESFLGTCSSSCKMRVINNDMMSRRAVNGVSRDSVASGDEEQLLHEKKFKNVNDYSVGYSTPPLPLYEEIKKNTAEYMMSGSHMISDTTQGRMLANLASMTREGRVLEIGTFVGYSTACILEGVASAAEEIGRNVTGNRETGAFVMTLERDSRAINLAASHLKIMSEHGLEERAADEASKMRNEGKDIIEVTDDLIYFTYKKAGCEILRVTDALATVEAMANGIEHSSTSQFDMVFIDGDKTRLLDYVEACLCSDRLLKKGGLMIVDNVLWKGHVLDASGVDTTQTNLINKNEMKEELSARDLKKSRRARKLANVIHQFNSAIVKDKRVEVVMLPIRDGLSIIRKK